uniref:uncharacterized protein C1orf115 homolog isoform X1 n=1 Tax=Podarcis muralis TaxID=64176 RepID=UPI00109F91B1|nr:uncharacterized protein C1orf115 homolog isoform X1 [Podarcis muralis]
MTVGGTRRANYPRRGPAEDEISILEKDEEEEEEEEEERRQTAPSGPAEEGESGCASKKVAFAVLPDKYEPLGGAGDEQQPKAERKSKKRRRKLKKYGKNVGKALQKGCRYLVLGLQGLANAYSSPLGVAVSIATAFR